MTTPPARPKIYHITHVDNLPSILADGGLLSDALMLERDGPKASIGMPGIKQRRLQLPVKCHPDDKVGEYVPFYFCPRSIMLYLIYMANHQNLAYRDGQGPIVHLEADLNEAIAWADAEGIPMAFTLSNAAGAYAEFRDDPKQLAEINWQAITETDFRDPEIKEGKQAEFLVRDFFPWALVRRIGVQSGTLHSRVLRAIAGAAHRPSVEVLPGWYY